jgi:hypothetical protein
LKKLLIIFIILGSRLFSQTDRDSSTTVDKLTGYPGGTTIFFKTITDDVKMDLPEREGLGCYTVYIMFSIDSAGNTKNLSFVNSYGEKVVSNTEAERIQSNLKTWKPAIKNGHPISVHYNVPMRIRY